MCRGVCLHTVHVQGDQKRASRPLELKLQMVAVSCCVGAGSSLRAVMALHYWVFSQGSSYLVIMPHHGLVAPNVH